MITLILACSKCCSPQSMWYAVVNSIPWLIVLILLAILLMFWIRYGIEWMKEFNRTKTKYDSSIAEIKSRLEKVENELIKQKSKTSENKIKEYQQVLRDISELCNSYDKILREKSSHTVEPTDNMDSKSEN